MQESNYVGDEARGGAPARLSVFLFLCFSVSVIFFFSGGEMPALLCYYFYHDTFNAPSSEKVRVGY